MSRTRPIELLLAGVLILLAVTRAEAAPLRVVVADPDPELRHAIAASLAPWQPEIVLDSTAPAGTTDAAARARDRDARFVIWRVGDDLVVFDRDRGSAEHRDGKRGVLDAPTAASAALTVKTLMRLPPPETIAAPPTIKSGAEVRVQTQLAGRLAHGSSTELGGRLAGAVLVRPWRSRGVRFGVAAELGTSSDVQAASFKGAWDDWAVLAIAGYTYARGRIEYEPYVAAGVGHSTFAGSEGMTQRSESATVAAVRLGFAVRWRSGPWTFGPSIELTGSPGTPTYTKQQGNGTLFSVPGFAFAIGGLAAIDFGR